MDFKKPSKKGIPKTEYKKNNLKDMADMAQGAMQGKMFPNKVKFAIGGAVALILIGAGTTLYWIVSLIKAFHLIAIIPTAALVVFLLMSLTTFVKEKLNKNKK